MSAYEIPLKPKGQTFTIALAGVTYNITLFWNRAANCWMINIADAKSVMLVAGIPLVTGLDLLAQYKYLGINGSLVVQTDFNAAAIPTLTNLGSESHLFFVTG